MKRTTQIRRKQPLRWRSAKRVAETVDREAVRAVVFSRDGGCIARTLDGHECRGPLTVHHLRKASQGGPYTPDNLVAVCAKVNDWVEDAPLLAQSVGMVVRHDISPWTAACRRHAAGYVVNYWPEGEL